MQAIMNEIIEILAQNKDTFDYASRQQLMLWNGDVPEKQPLLLKCALDTNQQESIPVFNLKEIHYDPEKMFLNELRQTLTVVNGGFEAVPSVRANMGASIFPSLLGVKPRLF